MYRKSSVEISKLTIAIVYLFLLSVDGKEGNLNIMKIPSKTVKKKNECGMNQLLKATYDPRNGIEKMKRILANGVDVNIKDKYGNTPLHFALEYGTYDSVLFLLENGADIEAKNNRGVTPIHLSKDIKTTNLLVKKGADIYVMDKDGNTPLHSAAKAGNIESVKIFCNKGLDVNKKNKNGNTPAYSTVFVTNNIPLLKILLSAGLDIKIKNNRGESLLYTATASADKSIDMIKFLVGKGLSVHTENEKGLGLLFALANSNVPKYEETFNFLLSKRIKINKKNKFNSSPLYYAVFFNNSKVVKLLLKNGADLHLKSNLESVVNYSSHFSKKEREIMLKILREHGKSN